MRCVIITLVNRNRIIVRFSLLLCITLCVLYATLTTFEYNGSSEQYRCGNTKLCKIFNYTIESTEVNVNILSPGINFKNVDISPDENLLLLTLNSGVDESEGNLIENLKSDSIPMNVHYFWCDQRWFEFKHYLSVMSVIRFLKPDKIVFHYEHFPVVDRVYYHQWIDNLIHDYPFFIMEQMTSSFCASDRESQISSILKILNEEGGLYVSTNTLMLRLPNALRLSNLVRAVERTTLDGFILQRSAIDLNSDAVKNFIKGGPDNTTKIMKMHKLSCMPAYHANSITHQTTCVIARDGNYSSFYPMNIWELNTTFGRLCRKIFYGTSKIRLPEPTNDQLVPNIGHMIWNGGGEMNFLFYLSVLSLLYVAKVDKVFIHGDIEIKGQYWQSLKQREGSRLEFITRTQPRNVFQDKIEPWFLSLMSDIVRVDIMIKYGGIYTDTDAIWVKPLTIRDRQYDATANFDWIDWSYPFPDSVNFGISYGKRNAPFWHLFRDSMRVLHNNSPGFTGVQMPYKLLEKYPHLLRIKRRLSVICYQYLCHPNWVPDYHNINNNHLTTNSIPNWREDVNAFHWTYPNPPEYLNLETLLNSTGLFAEIGKNVLVKAGLLSL